MSTQKPRPLLQIEYEEAAEAYLASLPLEHFMESTAQATQRKLTDSSLALVTPDGPTSKSSANSSCNTRAAATRNPAKSFPIT